MKKFLLIVCMSIFFVACNNDNKTAFGNKASKIDSVEKSDYNYIKSPIINPVIGIWTTRKLWLRYLND